MRKTNQSEPINYFLNSNIKKHPVSFHMPGHKYGRYNNRLKKIYTDYYDITEIPGADNIKNPKGIINDSIKRISDIYGSKYAYYLTNGTTSGIHAILRYASLVGKKVLLSRDCHISAVNGAILFGVKTVFIPTENKNGLPMPVTADAVSKTLNANPDACGVLVTSPNYYGKTANLFEISQTVHAKNMFLAVDEAHGAHFQFAGLANLSGINNGADIVCHSLHKTLPVYNQGAILHICSDRVNPKTIMDIVNMLGTTSPSYPLLASMERAVGYLNEKGTKLYKKLAKNINYLKKSISDKAEVIETDDFTRLVIRSGINGFTAANMLHETHNIDVEAADFESVICITTPSNKKSDFKKLAKALYVIKKKDDNVFVPMFPEVPKIAKELSEAYLMKHKSIPLDMAEGCICGTIIVSYPPGTSLLCPGEIIDGYAVKYIKKVINTGGTVLGVEDNKIPVLE